MTHTSVDLETFNKLKDLMKENLNLVLVNYLETTPTEIQGIQNSIDQSNYAALAEIAHPLKSTSAQIGALTLSKQFAELEAIGKSACGIEKASPLVEQVREEYKHVEETLREYSV